jgi:hypothetical protein
MRKIKSAIILGFGLLVIFAAMVQSVAAAKTPGKASKHNTKTAKRKVVQRVVQNPQQFIADRTSRILSSLRSRPLRSTETQSKSTIEVMAEPSKNSWLDAVYDKNMIESSWATEMLADKRLVSAVLEIELGDRAKRFYPRTLGLREFLYKHNMINSKGVLTASGDDIEQALAEEFPAGFVVRPAVGIAPSETSRGLFPDTDQFIVELLQEDNALYSPTHMYQPVKSHILNSVASGEGVVLQENVVMSADVRKPLRERYFQEVRVHTYEGRVVAGAVPERWVQHNLLTTQQVRRAEVFVGELLSTLPLTLLNRQAWGVDVAVMDNGEMRLVDIVTNRGRNVAWSSYLEQPRVIAAYARHFEEYYGMRFQGIDGALIRFGFANYLPYWEKRIEKSRPGLSKALAYLPPLP